ncbi:RHS repeat domain-containing protein [Burkholderia sp. BCC1977]|uniref:RHS repeat domain-containing protein n=1 Tax=Burkholderia sp. BCC1977 TaxID=2817440 RepID=UPI002ABDF8C1|nr:RHS repeat domain-containing protein [Burkholderia sp. BCC1977]
MQGLLAGIVLLTFAATAYSASQADYTYDALGRLTKAVYSDGVQTTTVIYNYDAAGNRTSVVSSTLSA